VSRVPLPPAPVRSCQRAALARPVVDESPDGARMLGDRYWHAVERATGGMVRRVPTAHGGCALRLRPGGPPLLSFAAPRLAVEAGSVRCSYPILGGVLAQSAGGALAFEQYQGATLELSSTVEGFHPRLAARPGMPAWSGGLYLHLQVRIHRAIVRRYLAELIGDAR
jgi:hypothetical protein